MPLIVYQKLALLPYFPIFAKSVKAYSHLELYLEGLRF